MRGERGERSSKTYGPAPTHLGLVRLQLQLLAHLPVFNLHAEVRAAGSPLACPSSSMHPPLPPHQNALCIRV